MKQAIVLAAGEGQRLRPFTITRPKTMLSIADKPILQYVIESLAFNGIRNIVIIIGYRKEQIFDYMGSGEDFGVEITYLNQEAQLGTAHALHQAVGIADDAFLVISGDNLIEPGTITHFINASTPAMLVKRVSNPVRYGVVSIRDDKVIEIVEKPREAGSNLVNTGIYAFTRDVFQYTESILDIPDVLNQMIEDGTTVDAWETSGTWLDVVYPWDILSLNSAILQNMKVKAGGTIENGAVLKGQVTIGEGTTIRSGCYVNGPVVIGRGCDIGPSVSIGPATSIGDNVVISSFSEIKNSVIGDDVNIGAGSLISDSVIDKGCNIRGRFTAATGDSEARINGETPQVNVGVMMGEDCSIGHGVITHPGIIIGNYSRIQMMKTINTNLPDHSLVY